MTACAIIGDTTDPDVSSRSTCAWPRTTKTFHRGASWSGDDGSAHSTARIPARAIVDRTHRSLAIALLPSCVNPEGLRNGEHMRFPELSRRGESSHSDAIARLDAVRGEQRRLADDAHAATGGPDEHAAASRLSSASGEVAAREAWVDWIERGV